MAFRRLLLPLVQLVASAGPSLSQSPRFDLEALRRVVSLRDARLSPDGKAIVMVVSRPNYDKDRFEGELVLIDVATGAQRILTDGRPEVGSPQWSPAGDRLAFIDQVGPEAAARPQVCVLPMAGGDARCVTSAPSGVLQFAWRPDGKEIAFATEDEPEKKTGEERHNDSFEVGEDHYLTTAAARPVHLWTVPADGGTARRVTSGRWSLTKADGTSPISWSPSGDRIAVAAQDDPHSGNFHRSMIRVVDLAGGTSRVVTSGFGMGPAFSPKEDVIAFSRPRSQAPWFSSHAIWVVRVADGVERLLTSGLDRTFYGGTWTPDGQALLLSADDGTRESLWIQPLDGPPRRLQLGELRLLDGPTVCGGGALAFVAAEPQRPAELYYLASPDAAPRRLTDFNAGVAAMTLGRSESLEWDVTGGFRADGVLTFPPEFAAARKYPLVLLLHGGPMGASTLGFAELPQLLAAKGWVVFEPNYRGSDNRGNAYQSAIIGDAGDGPGKDVMAGLAAVLKRGFVDSSRIGVSGWSYGGFMTTWLMGHYQVWKAAVAGAAVTDHLDSYDFSDINVTFAGGWGGPLWRSPFDRMAREQSPISYIAQMRTPTLILSNTGDVRVPVVESYKLYRGLKDRGVPVKFVAYPVPGHFPGDPVRIRDVYRRWLAWFEEHLR